MIPSQRLREGLTDSGGKLKRKPQPVAAQLHTSSKGKARELNTNPTGTNVSSGALVATSVLTGTSNAPMPSSSSASLGPIHEECLKKFDTGYSYRAWTKPQLLAVCLNRLAGAERPDEYYKGLKKDELLHEIDRWVRRIR